MFLLYTTGKGLPNDLIEDLEIDAIGVRVASYLHSLSNKSEVTIKQISEKLAHDPGTISQNLKQLINAGWIRKHKRSCTEYHLLSEKMTNL